jgi:glycogen phosphorylase
MIQDLELLHRSLLNHLTHSLAKDFYSATARDKFNAVALSVRDSYVKNWINTQQRYYQVDAKRVYYLSLEFMLGRLLRSYILNLETSTDYRHAVEILGVAFEEIQECEGDMGLGNGGLGRLAACFLDSLATLRYPAYGYGIRYEYGIFSQMVRHGYQVEAPDNWLRYGNPWEFPRPEVIYPVQFHGRVSSTSAKDGRFRVEWVDAERVMAMAYDYPVPGYHNDVVNTLRLWAAKSTREFDLSYFNSGDYLKAVEDKNSSENISKVLYPNDQSLAGKELRLQQQYFFVSATLRDILRRYKKTHMTYRKFPDKVAIQLNDTHPTIAIAELMRIFVDEENVPWDDAWSIAQKTFAYTNHTVLPEALETWSEGLFAHLLPRHLQIIQEIDRRFQVQVDEQFPKNQGMKGAVAIITGSGERLVHMARLAIVGSNCVNGVSKLHTKILKERVFRSFDQLAPGKFVNITNGITPRRWLMQANPPLASLITEAIGDGWKRDLAELKQLEPYAGDQEFREQFRRIRRANKEKLSKYLKGPFEQPLSLDPDYFLDCQIKRFHEYKRQLLNILHVITLYNRVLNRKLPRNFAPRTFLFSGKAAPSYAMCKLVIKLIHSVGEVIAEDSFARQQLQVVFVPNYSVSLAEMILPAAELSEQISTAGYEASGTGNMKFTLNGALTIGTLDGANVEICEEVGEENFFRFGLAAHEVEALRPNYRPRRYYEENGELRAAIDQIAEGYYSPENARLFHPIVDTLLSPDPFFVLADYGSYVACQEEVTKAYSDSEAWTAKSILNIARAGTFSSDRAIKEYAQNVWGLVPVP